MDGYVHHELVMGTMIAVHVTDPLPQAEAEALIADTFAWMHEVDRRFSPFKDDSEVCRLNRGEIDAAGCSPHMREVLDACADLWPRTDGYFDVYATGKLDPCGYVKGWAAEVASRRLFDAGCRNHMINAGGDIRVRGNAAPGVPWHVPVRHPWRHDGIYLMLAGTDMAVATSGTYERGFHVINPHTGDRTETMRSVTVVGPDLAVADAYATTAVAMGEAGLTWLAALAAREGYESSVVTEDGRGFTSANLPMVSVTASVPAQTPG